MQPWSPTSSSGHSPRHPLQHLNPADQQMGLLTPQPLRARLWRSLTLLSPAEPLAGDLTSQLPQGGQTIQTQQHMELWKMLETQAPQMLSQQPSVQPQALPYGHILLSPMAAPPAICNRPNKTVHSLQMQVVAHAFPPKLLSLQSLT